MGGHHRARDRGPHLPLDGGGWEGGLQNETNKDKTMPNWIDRLRGGRKHAPAERKAFGGQTLLSLSQLGAANWSGRGFASLVNQGFARNPVVDVAPCA